MKEKLLVLFMVLLMAGCAVTTTMTLPNGDIYTVVSKDDALVQWKDGEKEYLVDLRGRPGMIEKALTMMLMNLPDVTVGK